ncbi:MAG: DUF4350 domain-containing protein [Acidothermaceae bacterium]
MTASTLAEAKKPGDQPIGNPSGSAADPTIRQRWRRYRIIAAVVIVVIAVAVISTMIKVSGHAGDLDPRSYDSTGTHALAALLDQHDVHVATVTDPETALAGATAGRTLVVVNPDRLDDAQLAALAATPSDLVVVGAGPLQLGGLDLGVHPGGSGFDEGPLDPQCTLPAAVTAGAIETASTGYEIPDGGIGCYPVGDGYGLLTFEQGGRQVTLLGDGSVLTNAELAKEGDAALGLGLLEAHADVVWLAPPLVAATSEGNSDGQTSLTDLLPSRLKWAVLQLAIAVGVLALWRGRRMGRLLPEALPVVVRQAETVVGRARLYRRAKSYDKAAEALRAGARDRLARRLGFAPGADHDALVDAIALRLRTTGGRDASNVNLLLYGPTPADDHALVDLARQLTALEQEVRTS